MAIVTDPTAPATKAATPAAPAPASTGGVPFQQAGNPTLTQTPAGGWKAPAPAATPAPTQNPTSVGQNSGTPGNANLPANSANPSGNVNSASPANPIQDQLDQETGVVNYNMQQTSNQAATFGLNAGPTTIQGVVDQQKADQAQAKSALQTQITAQDQADAAAAAKYDANAAGSAGANKSTFAQGREGAVSGSAPTIMSQFQKEMQTNIGNYKGQLAAAQASRDNLMTQLDQAQRNGDQNLAKSISEQLSGAQVQIDNAQANLTKSLADANSQAVSSIQTLADNGGLNNITPDQVQSLAAQYGVDPQLVQGMADKATKSQLTNDQTSQLTLDQKALSIAQDSFINNGQPIDYNTAKKLSDQTNLPIQTIMSLNARAVQVQQDNTLSDDQKQAQTQMIQQDAKNALSGIYTQGQKDWQTYNQMVKSGTFSQQQLTDFLTASNLNIADNPETATKDAIQQAQATIDGINAQYQGGNPPPGSPDDVALKKAQADLAAAQYTNQQNGVTGGGTLVSSNPDPSRNIMGFDFTNYAVNTDKNKDGTPVFKNGVDPSWSNGVNATITAIGGNSSSATDIQNWIDQTHPKSPLTGDMIQQSADKYGVPAVLVAAIANQESSMGTSGGRPSKTMNPGDVGNTNDGSNVFHQSWQSGLDALAKNISERNLSGGGNTNGLISLGQIKNLSTQQLEDGVKNGSIDMNKLTPQALANLKASGLDKTLMGLQTASQVKTMDDPIAGGSSMNDYTQSTVSAISNRPYLDPSTISDKTELSTVETAARNLGIPIISSSADRQSLTDLNGAADDLNTLQSALDAVKNIPQDTIDHLASLSTQDAQNLMQNDPSLAPFQTIQAIAPKLVTAISGLKRVNPAELGAVTKALPNYTDVKGWANAKLDTVQTLLKNNETAILGQPKAQGNSSSSGGGGNWLTNILMKASASNTPPVVDTHLSDTYSQTGKFTIGEDHPLNTVKF